jgi:polar amino acid transport system permease protein
MIYELQFHEVWQNLDILLWGAWLTVRLSAISMALGLIAGIACAFLRTTYPRIFKGIIEAYVEIIRNTPFLVQIFLVYFGLPAIGIRLDANSAAIVAMVLNFAAYASEIVRAGIESISRGQIEAGYSLGLHRVQVFWLIVLRPALQAVYPAMTSQFMLLMLTSSVLSVISAEELTAVANNIASQTFRNIEVYIVIAVIYLGLSLVFSVIFALFGRFVLGTRGPATIVQTPL